MANSMTRAPIATRRWSGSSTAFRWPRRWRRRSSGSAPARSLCWPAARWRAQTDVIDRVRARARQQAGRRLRQDRRAHAAHRCRGGGECRARGRRRCARHRGRRLGHRCGQDGRPVPRQRRDRPGAARRTSAPGSTPTAAPSARRSSRPRVRSIAVPTTLSAGEFTSPAGCTDTVRQVKESYGHPLMMPRSVILDPATHRAHAGMAVPVHRHPRRRSCGGGHLLGQRAAAVRRHLDARAAPARPRAARGEGRSRRSRGAARLPARCLDVDHGLAERRARRAPATASAMCWAAPPACRTAIPPASCCRRCCASTSRSMPNARRWVSEALGRPGRTPPMRSRN